MHFAEQNVAFAYIKLSDSDCDYSFFISFSSLSHNLPFVPNKSGL